METLRKDRSGVVIVNFEYISHLFLVQLLLSLLMFPGKEPYKFDFKDA